MKKSLTLIVLCCCFSVVTFSSNITTINQDDLRPKFRIGFNAPEIDHRQILLTIDENTCDGFDWGYDAEIFQIFNDDMYWLLDNTKYVIQATNCLAEEKEFALGIRTVNGGLITIGIDQIENPIEGYTLYLKDKVLNEIYNIEEEAYQVALEAGEYHSRFVIIFISTDLDEDDILVDTNTGNLIGTDTNYSENTKGNENDYYVNDNELLEINNGSDLKSNLIMYVANGYKTLTVKNTKQIKINNLILYNRLGQITQVWDNVNYLNNEQLNLQINAKKGVYIIQATTEKGNISKRILL
ncbi:MAG: T9SS type A sorting domain-containing protein [Lutibacter sp.]|uniref:T9SS type A sorting domain-containing protein n=1 Tax=Lutibacter sp. TaxID=1925666 RepID=UPI0017BE2B68|nr:T9SS type A sorting domain-containing protein [Lutibacter sp.]MBT8317388.1 T9SS type A sorting domain-containing protein [Lutibacter sp.]NNJ58247.1 T9SS type A sorting domain-containing protein [Lutibacter sp.]